METRLISLLDDEQRRNGRIAASVRAAGVAVLFAFTLVQGYALKQSDWLTSIPLMGLYALIAGLLAIASYRIDSVALWAPAAFAFVDVPTIAVIQWNAMGLSPSPGGVAATTALAYSVLIALTALSLRGRVVWLVTSTSMLAAYVLAFHAGIRPSSALSLPVLLALAGAASQAALSRLRRLLNRFAEEVLNRQKLGRYFSPSVVQQLLKENVVAAQAREVTVLFADIRDFTSISENMKPEDVVRMLNEYHSCMVEIIFRNRGTLDKFLGDGLMAYFGGPLPDAEHALHAVQCTLEMKGALEDLNKLRAARGDVMLRMGIGLHTGQVILGDVGAAKRLEYTAIGDTVNVASRMEGLTKRFDVPLVASKATREQADQFSWRFLDTVDVKGKSTQLDVFALESTLS
jgi:adenylate cyclase